VAIHYGPGTGDQGQKYLEVRASRRPVAQAANESTGPEPLPCVGAGGSP
jgi:hypothetical protein